MTIYDGWVVHIERVPEVGFVVFRVVGVVSSNVVCADVVGSGVLGSSVVDSGVLGSGVVGSGVVNSNVVRSGGVKFDTADVRVAVVVLVFG